MLPFRLASSVVPFTRSRTNRSAPWVAPFTILVPADPKDTYRPSFEIMPQPALPLPIWAPFQVRSTRSVVPLRRSRTKISPRWLVSPLTRLVDCEVKATKLPSAEIAGLKLFESPCSPAVETLTRSILAGSAPRRRGGARQRQQPSRGGPAGGGPSPGCSVLRRPPRIRAPAGAAPPLLGGAGFRQVRGERAIVSGTARASRPVALSPPGPPLARAATQAND